MLQIHRSRMTCASAIFWDAPAAIIKELCHFVYFHHLKPAASVLDAGDKILLANIETPWSIRCEHRTVPIRHNGHPFAVIDRRSLCGCSITTASHYVVPKISNCDDKKLGMEILYPLNAAVLMFFEKEIGPVTLGNITRLYESVPSLSLPKVEITTADDSQVLEDADASEPVDLARLVELWRQKKELFLEKGDKADRHSRFDRWFTEANVAIGTTFVFSVCGTVALVICVVMCTKSYRLAALVSTLSGIRHADALTAANCQVVQTDVYAKMIMQLAVSIFLFASYHLLKRYIWGRFLVKFVAPMSTDRIIKDECDVLLELSNGRERVVAYMCTLKVGVCDIAMSGQIAVDRITVINKVFVHW